MREYPEVAQAEFEPDFVTEEGSLILEEDVVVTPDGLEILSARADLELPIAG